ncbi:MAG: hypothetical protein ABIP06_02430 [Pyrinomonadaceae bacterium]
MLEVLELEKSANAEQDTWILKLPKEICQKEGFAEGTLVSLTIKNSGIEAFFVRPPSEKLQKISERLLKKNQKLYEELNRIGD